MNFGKVSDIGRFMHSMAMSFTDLKLCTVAPQKNWPQWNQELHFLFKYFVGKFNST